MRRWTRLRPDAAAVSGATYSPPIPGPDARPEVPQYLPYIPGQDMNTSSGMPRSTLDGIHDDGGVVIKKPGELVPSSSPTEPPYTEAPPGSGVWVPDQRPYPPGSVRPAGWTGKAAEEADATDASLRKTREALNQADQGLAQRISAAHTSDAQSKTQLHRFQQEIRTGVAAMQPSLGTAAGREQLAEFLDRKGAVAEQVASNAQDKSTRLALSNRHHHPVSATVGPPPPLRPMAKPEEFGKLDGIARDIGFLGVLSGPLVRSSYRASRLHAQALATQGISS